MARGLQRKELRSLLAALPDKERGKALAISLRPALNEDWKERRPSKGTSAQLRRIEPMFDAS